MDLYFSKNQPLRFRFPVTPRSVSVTTPSRNRTVSLIDSSEISVLNEPGLREIAFEALLPNTKYPFAVYTDGVFTPADYYLGLLERLQREREPFIFTLGGRAAWLSLTVALEGYTTAEDASYGGDVMVSVRLREARSAPVKVIEPQRGEEPAPRSTTSAVVPRTYTVVRGDTLWGIAKRFLGGGARWPEIHALNRDKVSNPNLIYVGQVLVLP
ncbi:MAG: LysM peptidoglycan-binding domain-containing protein [Oscillospiraceae bacterium]|jgi:LysM repeat protein|nr:LysM peptidoglycan-binding domain-containing protein [Oscillospiraceae bacterium]